MEVHKMTEKIKSLRDMIEASSNIVAFTGAGCSTESGIADFRGDNGLFKKMGTNATLSTETVLLVPIFSA